jgi:small subunit ribosomal protein S30e
VTNACYLKKTCSFLKVEAGEKKKKKTGRAKRRIQYNRRFVNVVETFGRKKGPNSNS